jgi:hypothetical protein
MASEPAFPSVCLGDPGHPASAPGMSLRDWFAGQALGGACSTIKLGGMSEADIAADCAEVARITYVIADAMLAEREKGGTHGE